MLTPKRVKQVMYYSLPSAGQPIYERDEEGNIIYDIMPDGQSVPREVGETPEGYATPVRFLNSITGELTEDELQAFGAETTGRCKMTYKKGEFPFTINTLIWKDSEAPKLGEPIDEGSADYRIIGIQNTGRHFYKALMVAVI